MLNCVIQNDFSSNKIFFSIFFFEPFYQYPVLNDPNRNPFDLFEGVEDEQGNVKQGQENNKLKSSSGPGYQGHENGTADVVVENGINGHDEEQGQNESNQETSQEQGRVEPKFLSNTNSSPFLYFQWFLDINYVQQGQVGVEIAHSEVGDITEEGAGETIIHQ